MQHLDTADLIKSFIYPFISSVAVYYGGQIILSFLSPKNSPLWQEFKYGGAEEKINPKRLKIIRLIIHALSITAIVLLYIYGDSFKWIFIFFLSATYLGVFLNNRDFLSTIIPDRNFRLNFVFTIVLIPCLSFAFAKKKSVDIYNNDNHETKIVSIKTNHNQQITKYKLLGIASDFIFLTTVDNKSVIMLPKAVLEQIEIEKKQTDTIKTSVSADTVKPRDPVSATVNYKRKGIRKYISNEHYYRWTTAHPDASNYLSELTFHEEYAIYWYHGQCIYYYFTYLTSDTTIDLLWSYKTDCILNMKVLSESNGIKKYPKRGDTFATYTLINDTTIRVKYFFPDWVKRINDISNDSIFPKQFHRNRQNS